MCRTEFVNLYEEDEDSMFEYNYFVHPEFAMVSVEFRMGEIEYQAEGTAKRHPDDLPDPETAFYVAAARAFQVLANKLQHQAVGRVKHNDDMREASRIAKNRGKPTPEEIEERKKASREKHKVVTADVVVSPAKKATKARKR